MLLLGGCTRPPGSKKEIVFSFWGSVQQQKIEQRIVEAFEREHPDIKVSLLPIGQRYGEKIQSMIVGNIAPDVIMVEMQYYDEWASRGVLKDVTTSVEEVAEGELLPAAVRAFLRDGRYYAAPTNAHGNVLYCNLDALQAAGIPFSPEGWTWEEILALAPKLASRHGEARAPTEYAMLLPRGELFLASYGASLFDDAAHPTRVTANSEKAMHALTVYRKLSESGLAVPPDLVDNAGTYQLFRDGRAAFFFSGRWSIPELAGKTKFAWDVVPVPSGAAGSVTIHGGTGIGIWTGTRHPEEALAFMKFYAGRKAIDIAMKGGRLVPVYRDMAYGEEFLKLRPPASAAQYANTMKDGASTIPIYAPGYAEVTQIVKRRLEQVAYGREKIETITQGLQEDLERWLARRRGAPTYYAQGEAGVEK